MLAPDGANWSGSHPGHSALRKVPIPVQGRIGHASVGLHVMFELCVRALVVINGGLGDTKVGNVDTRDFFLPEEFGCHCHGLTASF